MYVVGVDIAQVIGTNLKRLREQYGPTQEAFCARTGIDQSSLSLWENGHRLKYLKSLADRLESSGIPPVELLRIDGESIEPLDPELAKLINDIRELPKDIRAPIAQLVSVLRSRLEGHDTDGAELLALIGRIDPAARAGVLDGIRHIVEPLARPTSSPGVE